MARLPQDGGDDGSWGTILNTYLLVAHDADGLIRTGSVSETQLAPAVQTKLNASTAAAVTSVNTRTGAVTLAKSDVGLANVDNTADLGKPISTATQSALDLKANANAVVTSVNTRSGAVTLAKSDVGLANVDNTADLSKPISTATQTALDLKANASDVATSLAAKADASAVGAKVLLINDAASLPVGTPAGVIVVVKA